MDTILAFQIVMLDTVTPSVVGPTQGTAISSVENNWQEPRYTDDISGTQGPSMYQMPQEEGDSTRGEEK
jgi:hypothetical protein